MQFIFVGEPIYIGRAVQSDDLIPGKVVPSHGVCYVPWDGRENSHHSYQVLTNPHRCPLVWVGGQHDGNVPPGALQGGRQADGTPLFIGRSFHNGSMVVGKVHPGHGVLYVPFDGQEVPIHSNYEVLVCKEILF